MATPANTPPVDGAPDASTSGVSFLRADQPLLSFVSNSPFILFKRVFIEFFVVEIPLTFSRYSKIADGVLQPFLTATRIAALISEAPEACVDNGCIPPSSRRIAMTISLISVRKVAIWFCFSCFFSSRISKAIDIVISNTALVYM
ncbi:MAG: hypothetical protein JKY82_11735 [Rhizobiaceae bacterium]|nr:hypothetical protein [Rhizobiaceae bacterium]